MIVKNAAEQCLQSPEKIKFTRTQKYADSSGEVGPTRSLREIVICMIDHGIIIKRHIMKICISIRYFLSHFQSQVFQVEINVLQSSVIDTYDVYNDIYISLCFAWQFQLGLRTSVSS